MPRSITYLDGLRFGRLIVIGHSYMDERRNSYWKCTCDCGNTKIVQGNNLKSGNIRSCGCLVKEKTKQMITDRLQSDYVEGTSLPMLTTDKYKNNKSGHKGVCWDKKARKWRIALCIKGNNMYLGCYENLKDAIKVRQEAEEKYYKPIMEKYGTNESR